MSRVGPRVNILTMIIIDIRNKNVISTTVLNASLDECALSLKCQSLYLCFVSTEIHSLRVITVTVYSSSNS